ncbi:aldo/keto reductase [Kribbella deserti]|uniref:Aldo/keto reductase n=1 Tax=Kribbella deserti TaxID=1926257 RepID=A0ABV6QGP0_9ACTN
MEKRRLGRLGHESSVLIYGAASLGAVDQDRADASIQEALDAGINHFDVAADYGDAELRLGPWMPRIRDDIFLATKTGRRSAEEAWTEINRSLERLQTDHVDLIQMHAVCDLENLDLVTGKGGSLEAAIRAKEEGLARAIGITGHTDAAPSVHTEALRRFDFDSVLTPLNYRLSADPEYAEAYQALVAAVQASDAALMTIKMIARRNWREGEEKTYDTWYAPFDEQRYVTAATAWLLNGHPEITGLATAGETRLLRQMVTAERERATLSAQDAAAILEEVQDYSSPFISMPF